MTIEVAAGPVEILHRLALGVEPIDALTRGPVSGRVRVVRQASDRSAGDLDRAGTARFKLRHGPGVRDRVTLLVGDLGRRPVPRPADMERRQVPRRFDVALWTLAEVSAVDAGTGPHVPVRSRLLRPWLAPGPAYPLPSGSTAIRGRVVRAGRPVRWPRVLGLDPGGRPIGWAHGDDRGEFLLAVLGTGTLPLPAPGTMQVDLVALAADPALPAPDDADPWADLVVEPVARSAVPPAPADLDNAVLRGLATPPGYRASWSTPPRVTVLVGEVLALEPDLEFAP